MKKKLFCSIAVLAIAAMAAFNININTQENGLSDVSLDNVEALASEIDPINCIYYCYSSPNYACGLSNGGEYGLMCLYRYPR
ncbi:MAG: NVEALA domain-containing protein [Rickettsiales bacterium]|jgi:hypothetical protein|nr:NVEALA domain-containing protein [Rickettsiales bacterium]